MLLYFGQLVKSNYVKQKLHYIPLFTAKIIKAIDFEKSILLKPNLGRSYSMKERNASKQKENKSMVIVNMKVIAILA